MEKILTKYFWVVILITLAVVAFFLASGTNELAAGTIRNLLPETEPPGPDAVRKVDSPTSITRINVQSGDIILSRNIFDSTYMPEADTEGMFEDTELLPTDGEVPLVPCEDMSDVKVLAMISAPRDPEWSFANLDVGGQKRLYRVGDYIKDREISQIGWRYILLMGDRDECYIDMFDQNKKSSGKSKRTSKRGSRQRDKEDEGITVDSEFERTVDRSIVDQALANPTRFAKAVRVRPYKKNGEVVGFRLRRVRNGSAVSKLGAKRGDILHSVNGIELQSVDDALKAYQKLRSDDELSFSITRRGKPVDLKINIE